MPEYLIKNPELNKAMSHIHDIAFFILYFQEPKYTAYYSQNFFKFMKKILPKSKVFGNSLKW